jgi:hypothetical protein
MRLHCGLRYLLALSICVSLFPFAAFAEGTRGVKGLVEIDLRLGTPQHAGETRAKSDLLQKGIEVWHPHVRDDAPVGRRVAQARQRVADRLRINVRFQITERLRAKLEREDFAAGLDSGICWTVVRMTLRSSQDFHEGYDRAMAAAFLARYPDPAEFWKRYDAELKSELALVQSGAGLQKTK